MPVTLRLEENRQVIYWRFSDPWTLPELTNLYKDVIAILDNADQTVHSLVNIHGVHQIAPGILRARYISTWDHPHNGYALVVGASPMIRNIAELAFRFARFDRAKFFASEAEARAFLRTMLAEESASKNPVNQNVPSG